MQTRPTEIDANRQLILVAVWGQAVGILWQALALSIEDAPNFLQRTGVGDYLWPLLVLSAMHLLHLDQLLARRVPHWIISVFVLIASVGTVTAAWVGVSFYSAIPTALFAPEWHAAQTNAYVTLVLFALALGINIVMIVRTSQRVRRTAAQS